jgi:hypothetical protein
MRLETLRWCNWQHAVSWGLVPVFSSTNQTLMITDWYWATNEIDSSIYVRLAGHFFH